MRTRTRNLRGLLALLREFGVTSYEHAGIKLTMAVAPSAAATASEARPAAHGARPATGIDRARVMMEEAGVPGDTAADLAATLGMV